MNKREEAQSKDSIIKYMLANPQFPNKLGMMDRSFGYSDFHGEVFEKRLSIQYIERLIGEIINHPAQIVGNSHNLTIQINDFTQRFIDDGGFMGEYNEVLEANKEAEKLAQQDKRIKHLTEENLKLRNKLTRWKLFTHWIPIGISIISLLFAAYSLLKPSNNVSQEQYNTKMESIEKDLKQLRIDFKQENDELKTRLYNAEMLIAIYESDSLH